MSNYQARALALLAGHGLVLLKVVELTIGGALTLDPAWRPALLLPIAGIATAFGALQNTEDKKRFWFHEVLSEICAVLIGLAIILLLLAP